MKNKTLINLAVYALFAATVPVLSQLTNGNEIGPRMPKSERTVRYAVHEVNKDNNNMAPKKEQANTIVKDLHQIIIQRKKSDIIQPEQNTVASLENRILDAKKVMFTKFLREEEKKYIKLALSNASDKKKQKIAESMLKNTIKKSLKQASNITTDKKTAIVMARDLFADELNIRKQITEYCYAAAGYNVQANVFYHQSLTATVLNPNPNIKPDLYDKISKRIEESIRFTKGVKDDLDYNLTLQSMLLDRTQNAAKKEM